MDICEIIEDFGDWDIIEFISRHFNTNLEVLAKFFGEIDVNWDRRFLKPFEEI